MKAVILTGGLGTRLKPMTDSANKHLLPVFDKPILHHLIYNLQRAGFSQLCFVLGGPHADQVKSFVQQHFPDLSNFAIQGEPTGIAEAVYAARGWVGEERFGVFLGDQFYIDSKDAIRMAREEFSDDSYYDASIWVRHLPEPWHHNVVTFNDRQDLIRIVEKPHEKLNGYRQEPGFTMIGFHLFRPNIFDIIAKQPSGHHRKEKNLADTITRLLQRGGKVKVHPFNGIWFDCGTPENIFLASQARRAYLQSNGQL